MSIPEEIKNLFRGRGFWLDNLWKTRVSKTPSSREVTDKPIETEVGIFV